MVKGLGCHQKKNLFTDLYLAVLFCFTAEESDGFSIIGDFRIKWVIAR